MTTYTYNFTIPAFVALSPTGFFISLIAIVAAVFILRPRSPPDSVTGLLPPGPKGWPILGCFMYLTRYPELSLLKWAGKYGPIYSFNSGDQRFVILSDATYVKDLMVTNGAIFSSRKNMYIKAQTVLLFRGITGSPYNETWRVHRRIATKALAPREILDNIHSIEFEAQEMIRALLVYGHAGAKSIDPTPYAYRAVLNNMLRTLYGTRAAPEDKTIVSEVYRISLEFMNVTGPVANMVDFVPLLRKLPNRTTARAQQLHQDIVAFTKPRIDVIAHRLARGEHVPDCLAKTLCETREEEGLDEADIVMMCGALIIGGTNTTSSVKQWFIAHIAGRPDIQAKAWAELDRVVGRDRLPNEQDGNALPYIRAIAKEVVRVHNPFWLGTPHFSTEDFVYRGYFIPKNTVVVANTYAMHHNPERYPNPWDFNPDRYIEDHLSFADSANLADAMERDHWTFGVGRRICPGIFLAEKEIFLGIASLMWAFKIESVPDDPIDLNEYEGLSGRCPVPFRVKMASRGSHVAKVLGV